MRRKALVVDDSASMRQLVWQTLSQNGFEVIQAANGVEALNRAATVELVITDLNMPVMDGITFIQKLRERADHKHTPVLLLTTESRTEQKAKARAAGATGWLTKPFDPGQLLATIKKVLP